MQPVVIQSVQAITVKKKPIRMKRHVIFSEAWTKVAEENYQEGGSLRSFRWHLKKLVINPRFSMRQNLLNWCYDETTQSVNAYTRTRLSFSAAFSRFTIGLDYKDFKVFSGRANTLIKKSIKASEAKKAIKEAQEEATEEEED
jgi:hypothetical protein